MAGERDVPVRAPRVPAGLAEQHLDQIPVHATMVCTKAVNERLDIEVDMPAARHTVDRKSRSDLQLLAERVLDKRIFHGHGMALPSLGGRAGPVPNH